MLGQETEAQFYKRHGRNEAEIGLFNAYRIEDFPPITLPFNRRDFYKISLLTKGQGILSYADRVIYVKENALIFSNPMIPYAYESLSGGEQGYFCLFSEAFISRNLKTDSLADSPLFKVSGNHVILQVPGSSAILNGIFENIIQEFKSPYQHKYDLLRSYVQIIIHEALKINPPEHLYKKEVSVGRIASMFFELLDRQFPIVSPHHIMCFKNASEFADQLAVHPDHLNRAVKQLTGKTTSSHIAERIMGEARCLLRFGSWTLADIACALGFQHVSNFIIFFKRHAGLTPNQFRKQHIAIS